MSNRDGSTTNRPPFFDGSNYAYWKARMRIFLQSMDRPVWLSTQTGYTLPTEQVEVDGKHIVIPKDDSKWDDIERAQYMANAKALNAICCAVSPDEFQRILTCATAKEAWDILEVTHEGTSTVRRSKLQLLTTKFENIRMEETETFMEFYTKLSDICNSMFVLGDRVPEGRICRKILRSLPDRFDSKIVALEECRDIDNMKVEELIGSLQTHELHFKAPSRKKNIALKSSHKHKKIKSESEEDSDDEDDEEEKLNKKFKRFLKFDRGNSRDKKDKKGDKHKGKSSIPSSVRCYGCGRRGHIAPECPEGPKPKGKKAMAATWDDTWESESGDSACDESQHKDLALSASTTTPLPAYLRGDPNRYPF